MHEKKPKTKMYIISQSVLEYILLGFNKPFHAEFFSVLNLTNSSKITDIFRVLNLIKYYERKQDSMKQMDM